MVRNILFLYKHLYKWDQSQIQTRSNTVSKHQSYCSDILLRKVYMKVVGGEVTSAAALAPKCGPIGLPPKKVGEDIQKATKNWRGVKIEIEIAV